MKRTQKSSLYSWRGSLRANSRNPLNTPKFPTIECSKISNRSPSFASAIFWAISWVQRLSAMPWWIWSLICLIGHTNYPKIHGALPTLIRPQPLLLLEQVLRILGTSSRILRPTASSVKYSSTITSTMPVSTTLRWIFPSLVLQTSMSSSPVLALNFVVDFQPYLQCGKEISVTFTTTEINPLATFAGQAEGGSWSWTRDRHVG